MTQAKEKLQNATRTEQVDNTASEERIEEQPLQFGNYSVSKGTAALLSCIEEKRDFYGHIREALSLNYGEEAIDEERVGKELFEALNKVEEELFSLLKDNIYENVNTLSNIGKYNKIHTTII